MRTIIIIADNAKQARQIAQQRYPAKWTFVKKDKEATHHVRQYIFNIND